MHYANGQEAKANDLVYRPSHYVSELEVIGTLVSATAGSTTCNGQMLPVLTRGKSDLGESAWVPITGGPQNLWCVTIGELMPVTMPEIPKPA